MSEWGNDEYHNHNHEVNDNDHEDTDQLFEGGAPEGDEGVTEGNDDASGADDSEGRAKEAADNPLLSVIADIRAPRDAEVKFTWGDLADFANFCLTHSKLSEAQVELFHGLAGVRTNESVVAVAQSLEKYPERARGLNIILPFLEKSATGSLSLMDGAAVLSQVLDASAEERNGIVRVLNAFLDEEADEKQISFRRNMSVDDLSEKILTKLDEMRGERAQEAVDTVAVIVELIKVWPGERRE